MIFQSEHRALLHSVDKVKKCSKPTFEYDMQNALLQRTSASHAPTWTLLPNPFLFHFSTSQAFPSFKVDLTLIPSSLDEIGNHVQRFSHGLFHLNSSTLIRASCLVSMMDA